MRSAVFFDIDGTLLTTARAGVFALEDAAAALCGTRPDLSDLRTAGLTDGEVAALVLERCGGTDVDAFLRAYEERLPDSLHRRAGNALPGAAELLEALGGHPDIDCLLLTGNTHAGAWAKLAHYGLNGLVSDGAYCEGAEGRESIAARARAGVAAGTAVYVVGDTPADVACGKSIGARTIAVATGGYSLEELGSGDPWRAFARLPDPAAFRALLELP